MLAWILVLNLIDAVATMVWVGTGRAQEANPLMAGLLDSSPLAFMLVKLALVSGGVVVLWRFRDRALALAGTLAVFLAYYGLLLIHISIAAA